jgi:hypothetical protein
MTLSALDRSTRTEPSGSFEKSLVAQILIPHSSEFTQFTGKCDTLCIV